MVPSGLSITPSGNTVYEDENTIFFQGENTAYYLDESNFKSFEEKLTWVKKFTPKSVKLLDVGAGFGHFAKIAKEYYDVTGIELSPQAVKWGRENMDAPLEVGSIYDLSKTISGKVTAVTFWDVIEHLPDPLKALNHLRSILEPGGLLFLSTPDAGSLVARLLGKRWYYIDPIQHIILFNRKNLSSLLQKVGFEVIDQRVFGRYYRLRYIFDRLTYLYPTGPLKWGASLAKAVFRPFQDTLVYLKLWDVMGIAARRL